MAAYGFYVKMTESDCVAALMRMYQVLSNNKELKIDITVREKIFHPNWKIFSFSLQEHMFAIAKNSFVKLYVI